MTDQKNILILGEYFPPLSDWYFNSGPAKGIPSVYQLYEYLGEHHQVHFNSFIYTPKKDHIKTFRNGSRIQLSKLNIRPYYLWKSTAMILMALKSIKEVRRKDYDLVYGLGSFALVASLVGRWCKIKTVGRIYGTIMTQDFQKKNYWRLYTRFILDILFIKIPTDTVIATKDGTDYDKIFQHFNPKKPVHLVYNGIDHKLKEKLLKLPLVARLPSSGIRFCSIARLESYKRHHLSILVIEQLIHQHRISNVHLSIVGSGSFHGQLMEMVKSKGLEDKVSIQPPIGHDQIPQMLQSYHAAFFLYAGGSLGNILWETTLAGRLLICAKTGSTDELFIDGRNAICKSDDTNLVTSLAKSIADMIDKDIANLTSASRQMVDQIIMNWERRFELEFEEILHLSGRN